MIKYELSQQIEQLKDRYKSDWEACRDLAVRLELLLSCSLPLTRLNLHWLFRKIVTIFGDKQLYDDDYE